MLKLKQTPSQRPLPILSAQLFPLKAAAYSKDKLKLLIPTMQQFQRLFQDKLGRIQSSSSRVPVTCSLLDAFHSQKALMESSLRRRENTARKNQMTAQENLKYRQQLEQKLRMLQQKHSKNRKEALSKVVKSEQRRNNYRRDILSKHHENDKNQMREKLKLSRQHAQDMQEYWSGKKMKTQRSFRSQSAVKPLYGESVERKYALQRGESERGLQVREKFIERHEGREEKVHNVYLKKKEEVLLPQREQFSKVLQQGEDILDKRITSLINSIGDDFRMSGQVLKGKFKALQKKLKDKKIDDYDHKMTVRSNFLDRAKQRSSSLSQCVCKRINNIEEAVSPLLKETARHMHLGDTLKKLQREPSETRTRNSQFLTRSQSFRSTTAYNQSLLSQRKQEVDTERLRREREIAQSLALKRTMEVEGNCYVRKTRVA